MKKNLFYLMVIIMIIISVAVQAQAQKEGLILNVFKKSEIITYNNDRYALSQFKIKRVAYFKHFFNKNGYGKRYAVTFHDITYLYVYRYGQVQYVAVMPHTLPCAKEYLKMLEGPKYTKLDEFHWKATADGGETIYARIIMVGEYYGFYWSNEY